MRKTRRKMLFVSLLATAMTTYVAYREVKAQSPAVPEQDAALTRPQVAVAGSLAGQSSTLSPPATPRLLPSANPQVKALAQQYDDLQRSVSDLVREHRGSESPSELAALRKRIEDATNRQFDLRQQARELELSRLRTRLANAEEQVTRLEQQQDQMVARRLTELLDDDRGQGPDPPAVAQPKKDLDFKLTIHKDRRRPVTFVVEQDGRRWEVTDEELDKLPTDVGNVQATVIEVYRLLYRADEMLTALVTHGRAAAPHPNARWTFTLETLKPEKSSPKTD
jgi:hypothetical protein